MSVHGFRWYTYVDRNSGTLARFEASSDNEGAKDRVMRSLRYGEANGALTELVMSQANQREHNQAPSRHLDLREIVELYDLTIEGLEKAHKICKRDVDYNFLCQFPEFSQFPISLVNELVKRAKGEYVIYEKKYHEDPEWQAYKTASLFVDQLLQKKNQAVVQDIVGIAQRMRNVNTVPRDTPREEPIGRRLEVDRFSDGHSNSRMGSFGNDSQSVETSPLLSSKESLPPQASQNGFSVGTEVPPDIVREVASRLPDGRGSGFGNEPDGLQIQSMGNSDEDGPPPVAEDSEDWGGSDDEVGQSVQKCVDELKNEIRNFVRLQLSDVSTVLCKLCCKFLASKASSKRSYEIGERGKTIGELFYSDIKRKFKTGGRKLQMADSQWVSTKQFIDALKGIVSVARVPGQEKKFVVEVTDQYEQIHRLNFDETTERLGEMVSEKED
ncbi:MAG: hypothetical protein LBJ75_04705 [Puniceicoccales bacterium]|jgi:hypothetical protein|nr:hypothetical protein [Puniceicoccales bacterium]